jgi:hypothetical protein
MLRLFVGGKKVLEFAPVPEIDLRPDTPVA